MTAAVWQPKPLYRDPVRNYWRGRHVVYRLYADGFLLYIGASSDPAERMAQHRRSSTWFSRVTKIVMKVYPTRLGAFAAERDAIGREQPVLNVMPIAALISADEAQRVPA